MKMLIKMILLILSLTTAYSVQAEMVAVDGDSLLRDETRIRLEGIDAPEFLQMCNDAEGKEYACGQAAHDYLRQLMSAGETTCQCLEKSDKYNRLLCECFVNDVSLNKQMISSGWAVQYRTSEYTAEEDEAMEQKKGIWQGRFMRPALYRALERLTQKKQDL